MKLASSPTIEGIKGSIRAFYFMPASHDPLIPFGTNHAVLSESGRTLETRVVKRGKRYIFETIAK